jgi:hypothetical protein
MRRCHCGGVAVAKRQPFLHLVHHHREDPAQHRHKPSRGLQSHSDAAQHILYGESRMKHTKKRLLNDSTAHG